MEDSYILNTVFNRALLSAADLREARIINGFFFDAILCGAEMSYGDYRLDCQ